MSYAQKDYPQKIGSGDNTIAESGPLLVAITNLLEKFGYEGSPAEADKDLQACGVNTALGFYIGHVSVLMPSVAVAEIGIGAPTNDKSIVKLSYNSKLRGQVETYAAVASAADKTIIDSYDGTVKSWDVYGGPVEFVSFGEYPLVQVTPLKAVSDAPAAVENQPETYTVLTNIAAYNELPVSGAPSMILPPGEYQVLGEADGMISISKDPATVPAVWIYAKDNVAPIFDLSQEDVIDPSAGIFEEKEDEAVAIPVTIKPPEANTALSSTYKPQLGPVEGIFIEDTVVKDLAGKLPDQNVPKGTLTTIVGRFTKDNHVYLRTQKSAEDDTWYGIPVTAVRKVSDFKDSEEELDRLIDSLSGDLDDQPASLSMHDKVVKAGATAEGKVKKLLRIKK